MSLTLCKFGTLKLSVRLPWSEILIKYHLRCSLSLFINLGRCFWNTLGGRFLPSPKLIGSFRLQKQRGKRGQGDLTVEFSMEVCDSFYVFQSQHCLPYGREWNFVFLHLFLCISQIWVFIFDFLPLPVSRKVICMQIYFYTLSYFEFLSCFLYQHAYLLFENVKKYTIHFFFSSCSL